MASISLAGFFRQLYTKEHAADLDSFSRGGKDRDAVLEKFQIPKAVRDLLAKGCVRDIIRAMAATGISAPSSHVQLMVTDQLTCKHRECWVFMLTVKAARGSGSGKPTS